MTDRCEPPPELRGVDGWHWVALYSYERPLWWSAEEPDQPPAWIAPGGGRVSPETARGHTYRYLAPVTPPAEVEALKSVVAALQLDIAKVEADAKEFLAERDTLRATVAQLREAVEKIVSAFGDLPCASGGLLDIARAALANAKGTGE